MIAPLETRYKGYRFRSRLEARWAVFFDAVGVEWDYEAEGYDLKEHGWYLPDFVFSHTFVEIKPDSEPWEYPRYLFSLARRTGYRTMLLRGTPGKDSYGGLLIIPKQNTTFCCVTFQADDPRRFLFIGSSRVESDKYMIGFTDRNKESGVHGLCNCKPDVEAWSKSGLSLCQFGYEAARSARFEHGESGAPK